MVVTGREGQVVCSLAERAAANEFEVISLGRPELDLCNGGNSIFSVIERAKPDVIVSAAAYTAVDKAESEPDLAYAVNERGAAAVARTAGALDVPLIHLSTDYVFDGTKPTPYVESDPPNPNSVYGKSKLAGEQAVLGEHQNCAVLRTAWVYSPFGANFVKTMLRLAHDRDEVGVVGDQHGNPSSALDIADAVLQVARNLIADEAPRLRGVFHMTGSSEATWAEFAEAIFEASVEAGGPTAAVRHIGTEDFPTIARRPKNSRLNSELVQQMHGVRLPEWRSSLKAVVARLQER